MFCTFQNLLLLFFANHVLYTAQGALLKALSRIIPWNEVEESVEKRLLGNQQSFQYSYGGCHSTAAHPSSSRSFPRHRLTALTPRREVFSDCIAPRPGSSLRCPAHLRTPTHPAASAAHRGGVGKYLACDGMPPVCRSEPPRIWQLWPMLQAPIHPKCSLARCTKLLETLGQGKLTYSAPIQFITVWKSPSGGSYVGCPSSGHGLTLT